MPATRAGRRHASTVLMAWDAVVCASAAGLDSADRAVRTTSGPVLLSRLRLSAATGGRRRTAPTRLVTRCERIMGPRAGSALSYRTLPRELVVPERLHTHAHKPDRPGLE